MDANKENNASLFLQCAYCSKKLKNKELTLVHRENGKIIFHSTCSRCHISSLIMLAEEGRGMMGLGVITDLDREEIKGKMLSSRISADEIISIYQFFNEKHI